MSRDKYRIFFHDCEEQLAPVEFVLSETLSESERIKRSAEVRTVLEWLKKRVVCRCRPAMYNALLNNPPYCDLVSVSDVHRYLIKKHFGDPVAWSEVAEAFFAFANGELISDDPRLHHQPESADFYCWFEFSLSCIEIGQDICYGSNLCRILAASEEIYSFAHKPDASHPPVYLDYSKNNFFPEKALLPHDIKTIEASYKSLTVNEVFMRAAQNSYNSFRGLYSVHERAGSAENNVLRSALAAAYS